MLNAIEMRPIPQVINLIVIGIVWDSLKFSSSFAIISVQAFKLAVLRIVVMCLTTIFLKGAQAGGANLGSFGFRLFSHSLAAP